MHGEDEKRTYRMLAGTLQEKIPFGRLDVDVRIILK
jgi:hypothetical protein